MSLTILHEHAHQALLSKAADDFLRLFEQTMVHKDYFDVALAGGTTAKEFYGFLVKTLSGHKHKDRIRFFFSDERVVPLNSEESNAGNALRLLLTPLSIPSEQFFPMFDGKESSEIAASLYAHLLSQKLTTDSQDIPRFDLLYLGIGLDGHTASLFPKSPLINDHTSHVIATRIENIPYDRITLMPIVLKAAKHTHVMALGANKAAIIQEITAGPFMPNQLPAQLVLRAPAHEVVLYRSP